MSLTGQSGGVAIPRLLALVAVVALGLSACISSEPPPSEVDPVVLPPVPTAGATEFEPLDAATIALVEDYWAARDAAWSAGVEAGLAFTVANNAPGLDYTPDECREAFFNGVPPVAFAERNDVKTDTIARDPDFMMTVGPLAGRDLGEGLLTMVVAFRYEGLGLQVADRIADVHLQVVDDEVRHFLVCEPVEIQVVQSTGGTGDDATVDTDGSTTPGTSGGGGAVVGDPVTVLPPITATPVPVPTDGSGGGGGGGGSTSPPPPPPPPGSRPTGSGVDFCEAGSPGAQPAAGDYYLCPDDDFDPTATEPAPAATASEDVTRG